MNNFNVFEGNLYKYEPRKAPRLLRRDYAKHYTEIEILNQFKSSIRAGKYVWPDGYEVYFIYGDGSTCCYDCAIAEYEQIVSDWIVGFDATFRIAGCDINFENTNTFCVHCGQQVKP